MEVRKSSVGHVEQFYRTDNNVNIGLGGPGQTVLRGCTHIVTKATLRWVKVMEDEGMSYLFQYGPRQGDIDFRSNLAKFLSEEYGDEVSSDNVMLTCGATHGLHLMTTLYFPSGSTMFVEDPTYFIAIDVLREDLRMDIQAVPTDSEGINVEDLDERLTELREKTGFVPSESQPFMSMLYLVPTFNNPTGRCLSPERSRQLIKLARKHNLLIFCDDVYNLLDYVPDRKPPARLLTYDNKSDPDYTGHVVSNGTFSKILGPGVRVGWFETSVSLIKDIINHNTVWSGGSVNHYMSGVIACALSLGLQTEFLKTLREKYGARMRKALEILKTDLPPGVTFNQPEGGYFIWLEMPVNAKARDMVNMCKSKYGVTFVCGEEFSPSGLFENCIRISISFYDEEVLLPGVKKLCQAITEYLATLK